MHKQLIFISRNRNEINTLIEFCTTHNIDLITHSFLTFEKVSFSIKESYVAIFFGSPIAVKFFFSQQHLAENCTIIGCIGELTAESLRAIGIEPTFVGHQDLLTDDEFEPDLFDVLSIDPGERLKEDGFISDDI